MVQIFGIELISTPRPPINLGARGVLSHFKNGEADLVGFSTKTYNGLIEILKILRAMKSGDPLLIIISGHGESAKISASDFDISLTELLSLNPGLFIDSWLHLSFCNSLNLSMQRQRELVARYSLTKLSGYVKQPLWEESFKTDISLIQKFIDKFK